MSTILYRETVHVLLPVWYVPQMMCVVGRGTLMVFVQLEECNKHKAQANCWRTYKKHERKEGAKQEPMLCLVGR
jgi:hypothetical protein